jgi:type III secretory pathway component EscU
MGYQRNENISCLWRCQNQTHQFEKGPKSNTSIWERAKITHIKIKQMLHERKVPKFHNLGIPLNCLNMRNYLFKYPQLFFVQIHVIFLIYTQKCVWYTRILKKSNKPYIVDLQSLLRNCLELFLELIMIMYLNTIIIIIVQNWHKNYKLVFVWDKVCQWFSPCTPVSSTNKTDRHNITEILLKVALNTIKQTKQTLVSQSYVLLYICDIHAYLSIKYA